MMRRKARLLAWTGMLLLLGFLSFPVNASAKAAVRIGDPFPSFALPDLAGSAMPIPGGVSGKVVIVHFWTDSCGNCRDEMPALETLYSRYNSRGLVIVAINVGQTTAQVRKFVDSLKITYPVLMDTDGKAAGICGVFGLPRTFILDREGVIRHKIIGEATEETLKKLLLPIL
jgi:cytochrome c biogenesis protein CcmG, thiol:disulfide interchange protein DsbE